MATLTDIQISELNPALLPATGLDELVLNQIDSAGLAVTRRIAWSDVGGSLQDLSGDLNFPGVKQIYFADGTEQEPSVTFKSDLSTGIYKPLNPPGTVAITSDGGEVMRATTQGTSKRIGIGFTGNESPEDAMHVKRGGVLIEFGGNNKLHFTSKNGLPVIHTASTNSLAFATDSVERGKFTGTGAFEIYNAFGVGAYSNGVPVVDHGDDGFLLLSQGDNINPVWSSPYDFIDTNKQIISNILINDPEFISGISDKIDIEIINNKLDEMNIGAGLEVGVRNDTNNQPEKYLYNTFIFGDHLTDI